MSWLFVRTQYYFSSFDLSGSTLSHMCIFQRNKNEPTIIVTSPTTTNIKPLPIIPSFDMF